MDLSEGVGIVKRGVMGQVLDLSRLGGLSARGLGMTGGWGVGGGVMTRDRYYVGTPRSYFESLSTSGPTRPVDSRSESGMTGGGNGNCEEGCDRASPRSLAGPWDDRWVGGGWGNNHVVLLLCGHPPLILRRAQHERPRPWGWLHAMGGSSRGGCSTFRAGFRGDGGGWEVGS